MALHLYADDSTSDAAGVFVFAGLIAEGSVWAAFSAEWLAVLHDAPRIEVFKMSKAHSLNQGLSPLERDNKVARLASLLAKHGVIGFSVTLDTQAFDRYFKGKFEQRFDHILPTAVIYLVSQVAHWYAKERRQGRVALTFDFDERGGDVRSLWDDRARSNAFFAIFPQTPLFEREDDVGALQAADLFAWHVRRQLEVKRGAAGPTHSAAADFLSKMVQYNSYVGERELRAEAATVRAAFGEIIPPHELALRARLQFAMQIGILNVAALLKAKAAGQSEVTLQAIPAKGLQRYRLVRSCRRSGTAHLHKRRGNECLAALVLRDGQT